MLKTIIKFKVYFDRARMYISYAQTVAVVLTTLKVFNIVPPLWVWPFLIIGFVGACLFVGYLDKKFGLFEAEQMRVSEQNPMLVEILKELKKK